MQQIEINDEDRFLTCPGAVVTLESTPDSAMKVVRLIGILTRIAMKNPGRRCRFKVVLD